MKRCCPVQKVCDISRGNYFVGWNVADAVEWENFVLRIGTGLNNRVGREVIVRKVHLRCRLVPTAIALAVGQYPLLLKFALVVDHCWNKGSVLPVYGDIYTQYAVNALPSPSFNSFPNIANEDRFEILFERNFTAPPVGPIGVTAPSSTVASLSEDPYTIDVVLDTAFHMRFVAEASINPDAVISGMILSVAVCSVPGMDNTTAAWQYDESIRIEYEDI